MDAGKLNDLYSRLVLICIYFGNVMAARQIHELQFTFIVSLSSEDILAMKYDLLKLLFETA